jgi:hypothetical protein
VDYFWDWINIMAAIQQVLAGLQSTSGALTYATWNPADKSASLILSSGDLTALGAESVRSTISKTSGKWYWELTVLSLGYLAGLADSSFIVTNYIGISTNSIGWENGGAVYISGSLGTSVSAYTAGDVLGFASDIGAGTIAIYLNNALQTTVTHGLTGNLFAAVSAATSVRGFTANFGASPLAFTPPSGFNAGLYI